MADLGALTTRIASVQKTQRTEVWWATQSGVPGGTIPVVAPKVARKFATEMGEISSIANYDVSGVLAGTVLDGVTPVANCEVWIFHRASKIPVRRGMTNASGTFSFSGMCKHAAASYFVVAFPPQGLSYNALIFDQIVSA